MTSTYIWVLCVLLCSSQLASSASFRCYETFTKYVDEPIRTSSRLVTSSSPCLNVTKPTTVVAIGFMFKLEGPLLSTLIPTLLSLGDRNVLLVNWYKEAGDAGLGTVLGYAVNALPNTKIVGEQVGRALATLVGLGLNEDIHFVGHSLGANLGGYAGKEAIKQGYTLPQITALDPARLGFDPGPYQLVDASSADFVDVVHCDVGGYAVNKSSGDVDIYTNFESYINGTRLQPGCTDGNSTQEIFSSGNRCSHDRCWQYYNVSLTNNELFEAGQAENYSDWVSRDGNFDVTTYIGPLVDKEDTGDFFLTTTSTYPWGKGEAGLKP